MPTIMVHLMNDDPVVCEVDTLPQCADNMVMVKNPRRRDGKDIHYLEPNVSVVYWPLIRINFIEVMPASEEEEIITAVRE